MSARAARAACVIAASVVVMAIVSVVDLRGDAIHPTSIAGVVPANGSCPASQIKLTGVYFECASLATALYCPQAFDQAKVIRLHGAKDDFLLYVEIDGAYHGPGTYQLRRWPHPGLGQNDHVAKVAIRDYWTGAFYESSAGSLSVDGSGDQGSVSAGLVATPQRASFDGPVKLDLNIAGRWRCS